MTLEEKKILRASEHILFALDVCAFKMNVRHEFLPGKLREIQSFIGKYKTMSLLNGLGVSGPISVDHTPMGKPFVKNSEYQISIAHSRNMVVVAASHCPVGVDIEHRKNEEERLKLLTPHERAVAQEKNLNFTVLWTFKEAMFKATGGKYGSVFRSEIVGLEKGNIIATFSYGGIMVTRFFKYFTRIRKNEVTTVVLLIE
ncbi:MAG: 4'-phosphopantetheinyl transferase superfamily protein [Sporolactobacillus sp.]